MTLPQNLDKHIRIRLEQCALVSRLSNCPRRKFSASLYDPDTKKVLADAYNGGIRGGDPLCGGHECLRTSQGLPSGQNVEIGCVHAEMNLITNCAAQGIAMKGYWVFVNGEPCKMCAKLLCQVQISKIIIIKNGYRGVNGLDILTSHGIAIQFVDGEPDPRG